MGKMVTSLLRTFNCERCGRFGTRSYAYDGEGMFGQKCIKKVAELHEEIGDRHFDHVFGWTVHGWFYYGSVISSAKVAAVAMADKVGKVVCVTSEMYRDMLAEVEFDKAKVVGLVEKYEQRGATVIIGR